MTRTRIRRQRLAYARIVLASCLAVAAGVPGKAEVCAAPPLVRPPDFPMQPINIFIPRGRASGALGLNAQIAEAIRGLQDDQGNPLGLEVNVLFKFGGDASVALDYFAHLPSNGYNVIQLNDSYASLLAHGEPDTTPLVPVSIAQIAFSQVYIKSADPRFSDLQSFVSYVANPENPRLKVAKFGSDTSDFGLEDLLLDKFAATFAQPGQGVPLNFEQIGFESGSARYFSLFDETGAPDRRTDAMIEQPGDVARLIDNNLLHPIFTLLPDDKVTPEIRESLGDTGTFPLSQMKSCDPLYRFRGFFVSADVPDDRRQFLESVFLRAFNAESFQKVNQREYMSILYSDAAIRNTYCSASAARLFFEKSVADSRDCLNGAPLTVDDLPLGDARE